MAYSTAIKWHKDIQMPNAKAVSLDDKSMNCPIITDL